MKKIFLLISLFISAFSFGQNVHNTVQDTSMIGPYPLGLNANLKTSANYFNQGAAFNNSSFAYGTSITYGILAESYYTSLQRQLGNTTFINYAVSSCATRTACRQIASFQGANLQGASIGDPAFNNSRWGFATGGLDTTHLFQLIKAGSRWLAAAQFTEELQFYRIAAGTVNSNVSTSQSAVTALALDTLKDFASRAVFFGTNIWWKQSVTANETITWNNVKGKTLIVGVWADSVGGSRIQYAVDGVTIGTYDPNKISGPYVDFDAPTGFHRLGYQNDVIVIPTGKDSLHQVVLTFLDGGKISGIDFIGNLKEPQIASHAPIYVMDVQHMNSTGYALTGGSAAVQDSASNSRWADLLNTFPSYVGSAAIVRVNVNYPAGHYNANDATQINSDGIHPKGPGYRNMVIDIIAAINPKSRPQNNNSTPGSNGQLIYNNAGTLGAAGVYWDGTHLTIGNSGTATDDISVRHDQSGLTAIRAWNANSAGGSGFQAVNDLNYLIQLRLQGSTTTAYGIFKANSGGLYGTGTGGMFFMQDNNNPISFATGTGAPAATRMVISGGGAIQFNHYGTGLQTGTTAYLLAVDASGNIIETSGGGSVSAPLDLGSGYYTGGFGLRQGDLTIQSNDAANTFVGYNTQVVGGVYKAIKTGVATKLHFFSGGGFGISSAASQSAGGLQTYTWPLYTAPNGQVQIGGNVSFSPVSWVDHPAPTTSFASAYFTPSSAVNPTTVVRGMLWDNGTNLYYGTGSGTKVDLLAATGYTLPTATTSVLGGVKIDGTSITISGGVISATAGGSLSGLTSGQILVATASTTAAGFSGFVWDGANNRLGVGLSSPLTDLHVKHSQTGFTEIRSENVTSSGQAGFQGVNDAGKSGGIRISGSTASAYGGYVASSTVLYSNSSAITIMEDAAGPINFATGTGAPAATRMVISSTGAIKFNTYGSGSNTGTVAKYLAVDASGNVIEDAGSGGGMSNPMTTTGDLIYSSSGSTPARLAIGSTWSDLSVVSGIPAYVPRLRWQNTKFTPTTGQTITLTPNGYNVISPAGTIATLTVNFPNSPVDGDIIIMTFNQTVTSLTQIGGTGGAGFGVSKPNTAGSLNIWVYNATANTWN